MKVAKNSDTILAVLVLTAAALVLGAPVLGRAGFPFVANVVVSVAAASGVAAFLMAAAHSILRVRTVSAKPARREGPQC